MKIIYNKIFPFRRFVAINIFGVLFARKEYKPLSSIDMHHEKIHTAQMKETLYIGFYLLYLIEWMILFFKYKNTDKAYYNIRFEKEAYHNEYDLGYSKRRKLYSWINY